MIRINMLDPKRQELNKAVHEARIALYNRSYIQRTPQLGRYINCPVCRTRHREVNLVADVIVKCEFHYATGRWDLSENPQPLIARQDTLKGVFGAAQVAKKRYHPHHNKKDLQLVQRTQQLYPENAPFLNDPEECMKESRKQAQRELKKERAERRRFKRQQQSIARRINFQLAKPGSRP